MTATSAPPGDVHPPADTVGRLGAVQNLLHPLEQALFPEPRVRERTPRRRLLEVAAGTAAGLLAFAVAALRLPLSYWDSLWAEDGSLFLQQALDQSVWTTLIQPYAGYLNAFPRLSAAVATGLPLAAAGRVYTLLAAGVVAWVAATVWTSSAGQLTSPWLRGVLAGAVVLLPAGALEAAGDVSNSHFFLVFGVYWALVGRPRSLVATVSASALVLLATLSDPVCLGLLPLAILRLACLRGWRDRSVALTFTVGILLQLVAVLSTERGTGPSPDLPTIAFTYGFRVLAPSFLGLSPTQALVDDGGTGFVGVCAAALAALLTGGFLLARTLRLPLAALVLASVAFWVVSVVFAPGYPPIGDGRFALAIGSRYTIIPSLLLLSAWVLTAEAAVRRAGPRLRSLVLLLAAAPVVLYGITDFRPDDAVRSVLTPWSPQIEDAETVCAADPAVAPQPATIAPEGWSVLVECSDLD